MAGRLIGPPSTLQGRRRGAGFVALVVGVAVVHGCVTRDIVDRMDTFAAGAGAPARIDVAYVRTLEMAAPTSTAPAMAPIAPARQRDRAVRPALPASVPQPASDLVVAAVPPPDADAARPDPLPDEAAASSATAAVAAAASAAAAAALAAAGTPSSPAPGASAPAGGFARGAAVEPFDWPASTRVTFALTGNYRGEVSGTAQVAWVRVGTRYQVHLDLLVGPEFAPLIRRRMTSDGELTADGLVPGRYDEDTEVAFRERRRVTVLFEPDAVVLANGQRRERFRGVQDTASQFVQLTWLFTNDPSLLKVGGTVEVPLALPRNVDRWTYDVLEEVELQTPFGPLPTFHLKPRRATQKPGDLSAEIWFAPQLRYLPVRIRIEQDPQTFLDLVIAKKPELSATR